MSPSIQGARVCQRTEQCNQIKGGGGGFVHPNILPATANPASFWRVGPGMARALAQPDQRVAWTGAPYFTMKKPRRAATAAKPPVLESSPFDLERVDEEDLSENDRSYLDERESVIQAGQRTFLDVRQALIEIKNYQNGRLYKRYGTFEAYCQERWEFGRSYAARIMDATEVYLEMLPRGNKATEAPVVLPTTEKQIRSLKKLPAPFRLPAWSQAVEAAVGQTVVARFVEKEVRKVMVREHLAPAQSKRARKAKIYRISSTDMEKIQDYVRRIKREFEADPSGPEVLKFVNGLDEFVKTLTGVPSSPEEPSTATAKEPEVQRVWMRRIKGWRKPPNTVYVGRPGKFGNPFSGIEHDPRKATNLYEKWITAPAQKKLREEAKKELRG